MNTFIIEDAASYQARTRLLRDRGSMGVYRCRLHYPSEQMFVAAFHGELAQRESTALAAQGSGVQIPYSPPFLKRLLSAVRRRLGAFVV